MNFKKALAIAGTLLVILSTTTPASAGPRKVNKKQLLTENTALQSKGIPVGQVSQNRHPIMIKQRVDCRCDDHDRKSKYEIVPKGSPPPF